jgi:glutamate-ammonia-ligase adenylyltransferase
MELLAADFTESLRRGEPRIEALRTVGDPDPGAAAAAFSLALKEPALSPHADSWVPALLRSARPGLGAQRLLAVARARRTATGMFDPRRTPSLPLVLGSSDFLARLLVRHPDWIEGLETPPSEPIRIEPIDPNWDAIRTAKYRGLLQIAAGDLATRPFRESLRALSNLADACLISAMQCTTRELGAAAPPMLFALGKLGGEELNFSSDVDLLFLYDASADGDNLERNQRAANFIRHFKKQLEKPTEEGFIYRVDLDLRPEGVAGPLANSVTAALDYYERFGAEWERQMLIRLRALSGPTMLAKAFCDGIRPFVYRRSIDPAVLRAVRDMKHRIESGRYSRRRIPRTGFAALSGGAHARDSHGQYAGRIGDPGAARGASRRNCSRTLDRLPLASSRRTRATTRRRAADVEIPAPRQFPVGARAPHGVRRSFWERRARAFDR